MSDTIKIYLSIILTSLRGRMEYKTSFIFYIVAILAFYLGQLGLLYVLLDKFHSIQGWSIGDIAFLYGLLTFAQGFTAIFFGSLIHFDQMIITGEFDRLLVRPLSPLGQVIFTKFEISSTAHFITGTGALILATKLSQFEWTFQKILFFPIVVAGGVLITGAIRLLVTAVTFWTLRNQSLVHTVVFSSREFVIYPITIYSYSVQFFLTFLFPIAFVNFYPSQYFLDKTGNGFFHPILQVGTPVVGIILFLISLVVWRIGINHYQSSGS